MINRIYVKVVLFSMLFSGVGYADVTIKSPVGGSLIFSQEKNVSTTTITHGGK